jgi:hypothetical protein
MNKTVLRAAVYAVLLVCTSAVFANTNTEPVKPSPALQADLYSREYMRMQKVVYRKEGRLMIQRPVYRPDTDTPRVLRPVYRPQVDKVKLRDLMLR